MNSPMQIHPGTRMGAVHLTVTDLGRMLDYYQRLGLRVHDRQGDSARLGAGAEDLLILVQKPNRRPDQRVARLYHFAILLPNRRDLSRALHHMSTDGIRVMGASDHLVSEALYLTDPEGNGIEVYRDREREEWTYKEGTLQIDTQPLDLEGLLAEADGASDWDGFPSGTTIGHVHLQVGNLALEEHFYENVLGFERVARYGPYATFVSAGGYHHHLGMNTWGGDLLPRSDDERGLERFTILLPTAEALAQVRSRLDGTEIAYQEEEKGLLLRDPQGIGVELGRCKILNPSKLVPE